MIAAGKRPRSGRINTQRAERRAVEMLGAIFERFIEQSPVSVMVRGLMERVWGHRTKTGKSYAKKFTKTAKPLLCLVYRRSLI